MKKYIYVISFIFAATTIISCSGRLGNDSEQTAEQSIKLGTEARRAKELYSPHQILLAISQIDAPPYLREKIGEQGGSISSITDRINKLLDDDSNLLDESLSLIEKNENSNETFFKIHHWCQAYNTITIPLYMNAPIFLEEIIYEIPNTQHIIKELAGTEKNWSDLSEAQLRPLPIMLSNYLTNTTEENRIKFYFDFFNAIDYKIKSKE